MVCRAKPAGLKQKNIKSIVTIHDLIFMHYPVVFLFDRKIHFKFKKAATYADKIIALASRQKLILLVS
jgi:hypothetical protein